MVRVRVLDAGEVYCLVSLLLLIYHYYYYYYNYYYSYYYYYYYYRDDKGLGLAWTVRLGLGYV